MRRGFTKLDPQGHEGTTDVWLTPPSMVHSLGKFDLDPCAHKGHGLATKQLYSKGLEATWRGRVWLNPPYGRNIGLWLNKLQQHGNGIALVFARTDTAWFHALEPDSFYFLKGRIKFLNSDFEESTNAGHGSVLISFGEINTRAIFKSGIPGRFLI